MRRLSLTDQQKDEMRRLRLDECWTYQQIATLFGTGTTNIHRIINPPRPKKPVPKLHEQSATPEEARAAIARLPRVDNRSLTGVLLGDPLVERSALAQRAAHV